MSEHSSSSSSSSSNDSHLHPYLPSTNFFPIAAMYCFTDRPSSFIFTTFSVTKTLLLLPLCIFILHLGLQRWQQQRSTSTAATSHSDSFTYHIVAMELFGILGQIISCSGILKANWNIIFVGYFLWCFAWFGEVFVHVLTCVERYLAVVHPITYLSLRSVRAIRIRNIITSCVWLLCIAATFLMFLENIFTFCLLIFTLIVISFCSVSVLYVLIHPGPGQQGGDRERVDQSKRRAFYTIVAILGMLLLKCFWSVIWLVLYFTDNHTCVVMVSGAWFNLPSSLVLPLLFLQRAGRLVCCKNKG